MNWINRQRLITYPRIIAVILSGVFLANIVLQRNWRGWLGGIISYDFLQFYAIGKIYLTDIKHLYDVATQFQVEQQIFTPAAISGGGNVYSYPPYVALVSTLATLVPYGWAYYTWLAISIVLVVLAAWWMARALVPQKLSQDGLGFVQLLFIMFGFFPLVFGFELGQNHALTLFLVTGIIVSSLRNRWFLAGILAGLLFYKPHILPGFIILWLVWGQFRALLAFGVVSAAWVLSVVVTQGVQPYLDYVHFMLSSIGNLTSGVGQYVEMSLPNFLSAVLPDHLSGGLLLFNLLLLVGAGLGIAWVAYHSRALPPTGRVPGLMLAILLPFLVAPHFMVHEAVLLIPFFLLWTWISTARHVLYAAILTYLGTVLLLFASLPSGVPLLAIIPLTLLGLAIRDFTPYLQSLSSPQPA